METKELRKLAEEIAYKYELTDGDGYGTDCVFIDDTIDAMLSFHEQASRDMFDKEFVFWFKGQTAFHQCVIEDEIFWCEPNWTSNIEPKYYTFDKLYQFWKDNIQGK